MKSAQDRQRDEVPTPVVLDIIHDGGQVAAFIGSGKLEVYGPPVAAQSTSAMHYLLLTRLLESFSRMPAVLQMISLDFHF